MIFSYKELEKFYKKIKSLGDTLLFREFINQKCFLIRHDIDWDLNAAVNLSILENETGIKSTYFVMVITNNYNVLSEVNKNRIRKIKSLGHEIALHFDASLYNNDFEKNAINESEILENIVDTKIESISLHNPSENGIYPEFKNFNNAYSKKYFANETYMSDSRFNFRDKEPFKFIQEIEYKPFLQILLHPLHYSYDGSTNYIEIFQRLLKNRLIEFDNYQMMNTKYKTDRLKNNYRIELGE